MMLKNYKKTWTSCTIKGEKTARSAMELNLKCSDLVQMGIKKKKKPFPIITYIAH